MPHITDQDYESLSDEVTDAYVEEGVPLKETILKLAEEQGMLPDQIRQLCWRTNVKTHLNLFEKKAEDKVVEFPLADAEEIISEFYGGDVPEEAEKEAQFFDDIDERDFFLGFDEPREKVAFDTSKYDDRPISWLEKEVPVEDKRRGLKKRVKLAEEELNLRILSARESYLEGLEEVKSELRKMAAHPDGDHLIPEFAHEALSIHDSNVKFILKDLGLPVTDEMLKSATFADHKTPIHQKLAEAKRHFDDAIKQTISLKVLRKKTKF